MLQFFKNALPIYVWCNSFVELITTDESHGGQTSENFRKQCETQILIPQEFEECFKNYSDKKIRHLHCLLWKYFLQYFNPQWRIQTAFFTPKNIWQISKERLLNSLIVMIRFSNLFSMTSSGFVATLFHTDFFRQIDIFNAFKGNENSWVISRIFFLLRNQMNGTGNTQV